MIVHDIRVSDAGIQVGYIKNEKEYPQTCTIKSLEYARPEFYESMDYIFESLAAIQGNAANECKGVIRRLSVKFTADNCPSTFTLSGIMNGKDGMQFKFTAEKISTACDKELTNSIYEALKEAELFVKGKRAQMELAYEADHDE